MLDQLGITVWRQRSTRPPKFEIVIESDQQDEDLLNNILKAIQCSRDEAKLIRVDQPTDLMKHTWSQAPLIVFGTALHARVPEGAIKTLSLPELKNNIQAKKALWTRLKAL